MPYNRPPYLTLRTRNRQTFQAVVQDTDPTLRRSFSNGLTEMVTGAEHGLYGKIGWCANQISVATCDQSELPRFGLTYNLPQLDGIKASGPLVITGIDGTDIPAGREVTIGGTLYTTNVDATPAGGTVTVVITAEQIGAAGNQDVAAVATFTTPIGGITSTAAVGAGGLAGGADIEDPEAWRLRLLARIGNPPGQWLNQDYIDLLTSITGVTRAWAYPNELDLGMMSLRYVIDDGTGSASIIPSGADVIAKQAVLTASCPAFGPATAVAQLANAIAFTLHNVPVANQAAVLAALAAYFTRSLSLKPGAGVIAEEVAAAIESVLPSGTDFVMTLPAADVAGIAGYLPTLGVVTFT